MDFQPLHLGMVPQLCFSYAPLLLAVAGAALPQLVLAALPENDELGSEEVRLIEYHKWRP